MVSEPKVRGIPRRVLEKWNHHRFPISRSLFPTVPGSRRNAGHLPKLVDQMRLVIVAELDGQRAPVDGLPGRNRARPLDDAAEPDDASERLRGDAHELGEPSRQMLARHA